PVVASGPGADLMRDLRREIERVRPQALLDLSDEPILVYERRMELVSVALAMGVPYIGPDFRFDPPITELPLSVPTFGVIGTGKRFASNLPETARLAASTGNDLVILEGIGASVPTVPWDAGVLVAPGTLAAEHLGGYLGPFRVLLSDLLILMMDGSPTGLENVS